MFEKALIPDNLGQNVCRIFHILVQFLFVSGERELDYYQQNLDYVRSKNQRKLDKFNLPIPRSTEDFKRLEYAKVLFDNKKVY